MARQVIDTSPPIGTPAPTAFGMINAMTAELYPLATGAFQKTGGTVGGVLAVAAPASSSNDASRAYSLLEQGAGGEVRRMDISLLNGAGPTARQIVFRAINTGEYRFEVAAATYSGTVSAAGTISSSNAVTAGAIITAGSAITSNSNGVTSNGSGCGFTMNDRIDFAQSWSQYVNGTVYSVWNNTNGNVFNVTRAGAATAASFSPISSADVKDNIEGYTGDADNELDRMVVIEYNYRPEFVDIQKRCIGFLAENVADVHPSASDEEVSTTAQIEVEREVEVEYPVWRDVEVEVLTPVEGFDPEDPQYVRTVETVRQQFSKVRKELRKVFEQVPYTIPRNVDLMQILALTVRAHQQKSKRIRDLEATLADAVAGLAGAVARIEALEAAA